MRNAAAMLAVCLVVAACGVRGGTASTVPRMIESELPAPTPAATHYGTDATAHPGEHAGEIAQAVIEAGVGLQLRIATDGRLSQLGQWAAQHSVNGQLPPHGAIDDAAHRLGLVEATPAVVVYRTNDASALSAHVRTDIVDLLGKRTPTHVGVGVVEGPGSTTTVVVLSDRKLTMQPLPRLPGALPSIELRGELGVGLSKPELVVMRPDGEIQRSRIGDGRSFAARAALGPAGVYRIELLAHGSHGITVVANFPLHAGVAESTTIRVETPAPGQDGDVGGALHALINRDRVAIGLPPLERRSDLDAIALGHSRDMSDNGFIGHTSPTTGSVADRVQAAGVATPLSLENIGRDYSAAAVHAALMASPGHRANILNAHATHVGIDLVRQAEGVDGEEGSREALLVTQVFIQTVARIDPLEAAERGLRALANKRRTRGLPVLVHDGTLDELARGGAEHYFGAQQPSQSAVMQGVDAAMRKRTLPYSQVQALALVGSTLELSDIEALLDPKARAIGVGFAQGERSDARINPVTIAVVLLGY